jgi:hypothetical protein
MSQQYPRERDRLVILTPCFAHQCHEDYVRSCEAVLARDLGAPMAKFRTEDGSIVTLPIVACALRLPNDSHIDRARNTMLHLFEHEVPYRFALFIDGDIQFSPTDVTRIWMHLMHGRAFACGHYAMKTLVPTFVANIAKGATVDPESGLIELNDAGTGFMGIDRDVVLPKFRAAFPERAFKFPKNTPWPGADTFAYFRSGIVERGGIRDWLSEDWHFCHDWKAIGGQVWGDTTIKLKHWGPQCFPPPITDLVEAVAMLTGEGSSHFTPELRAAAHPHLLALKDWCHRKQVAADVNAKAAA